LNHTEDQILSQPGFHHLPNRIVGQDLLCQQREGASAGNRSYYDYSFHVYLLSPMACLISAPRPLRVDGPKPVSTYSHHISQERGRLEHLRRFHGDDGTPNRSGDISEPLCQLRAGTVSTKVV